jgi:hypothetical protein
MIDHKIRKNADYASVEIWKRLNELEKTTILNKFPDADDITDSRVKDFLVNHYKDRLIEVIVK